MSPSLRVVLLTGLLVVGCEAELPPNDGFAGLGSAAAQFAQVTPGRVFSFPADHGAHPDFRIEWWYVTANLEDEQGRAWGVQWTLFRNALQPGSTEVGWGNQNLWMGHAGLTGPEGHRSAERFARGGIGQAGVETSPFKAWIDDWHFSSQSPADAGLGDLEVHARGESFEYQLYLASSSSLVLHGEQGFSRKSDQGQASYYYSLPFFEARGTIRLGGKTYQVRGKAWLDREWSSQPLAPDQQGWDWFSLHLESGEKLMLFQLRHADGKHYRAGTWVSASGEPRVLGSQDIIMIPLAKSRVAGRQLPTRWSLRIPSEAFEITSTPVQEDAWMDTRFPYWEGPIRFSGSHQGVGYLELTGY